MIAGFRAGLAGLNRAYPKNPALKVSEYPFKENKNTLKIIQVLLYIHFYNISLNVLRPNFLNICNLPISHFPNIRKLG